MISKIKQHLFPIGILIVISITVHHVWFFNLLPITHGDWMVDSLEKIKEYFSWPSIWFSDSGLGGLNFGISFWPFIFISSSLAKLNINIYLIERLVFLWPIALLLPIFMYLLSYYILRSKTAAFISAIVFEFNTYLIILKGGHLTLLMAITFTPVFLLFFIKTLNEKKLLYILVTSFFGFFISFYEFRIFYLACWLLLFYTIYHLIIIEQIKSFKQLIKLGFFSAIPVLLIFFLNFYFLLGIYGARSLTNNSIFNQPLFGAWYIKLTNMMSIRHFGWTGGKIPPWHIETIQLQFFLVPIFAFFGFLVKKNNKYIPFFAFLGFLGIFLSKQNTLPFPDIYQWLFDSLPGFNAFRESGKFLTYVSLSYAILIGAFIGWLWQKTKDKKQIIIASFVTILTTILFLWNTKPMITGELGSLFVPRHVPKDYLQVKTFLLNQRGYFRTLWIPHTSRWSFRLNNLPLTSYYSLTNGDWLSFADPINQVNSKNFINQLFDLTSVKYVVIPLEDKANDDNFFEYLGKRKKFISQMNKLSYLKKINIGTKEIVVYENRNYRPHIYLTNKKETIHKNIPYIKTDFKYINPTQYKISLINVNKPIYINFSESYHPYWRIRVGEFDWFKALTAKNYFLSDKYHSKNDALLNSFYIDPKSVCQNNLNCNINLTLYFAPQSYVYLGGIISLTTFTGMIGYFIFQIGKGIVRWFSLHNSSSRQ